MGGFTTPFHPADVPPCPCRGGTWLPSYDTLLPTITAYIHLDGAALDDQVQIGASGVARWEGEGPVSAQHIREFLGPHARFTMQPVIDLAHQAPSAGYEVRGRLREAVHLRNPLDVFPFASNTGRTKQVDHTIPHDHHPDNDHDHDTDTDHDTAAGDEGGAQPQTRMGNLGPMTGFHHRVKTHAGWQVHQPYDGIYLWKSPHGSIFLVDHTGTRQIRRPATPATTSSAPTAPATTPAPAPAPVTTPRRPTDGSPRPTDGSPLADIFWHHITAAA